jgi:putative addiction module component (TIGR02574 family)
MTASFEQIARDALSLTSAQRAELVDFLVESLDSAPTDEIQRLWIQEANKRLEEVRSGRVKTIPGEDVLAEARRLAKR